MCVYCILGGWAQSAAKQTDTCTEMNERWKGDATLQRRQHGMMKQANERDQEHTEHKQIK